MPFNEKDILREVNYATSNSGGPGGQHVNKVQTKVELRFHIESSSFLTPEEKIRVQEKLSGKINKEGFLVMTSQQSRSQMANKENVTGKFLRLLTQSLKTDKKRIKTKATQASVENRIMLKKSRSEIKKLRGKNYLD